MGYRVLMVAACPYPVPQGSQVLLRETARALRDAGDDVRLLTYGYGVGEDPYNLPREPGPRMVGYRRIAAGPSWAKPWLDLGLARAIRRAAARFRPDIVHAHNYEALIAALLSGARPLVYHAHNAMADELPHYFSGSGGARHFGAWLDRSFPKRAALCIAPHSALRDYLIARGCEPERVAVVPPSVDAEAFGDVPDAPEYSRVVLYTGNIDRYQNLPLLTAAIVEVRERVPEAVLRVATAAQGGVPGAETVLVRDVAELKGAMADAAAVACPRVSWSGYPIKVLNAMAAGRAVVACRSSAYPLEDGVTGLVVPNDDAEAMAAAIVRLLEDASLRRDMGRRAREAVRVKHVSARIAQMIHEAYGRLHNA